MDEMSRNHRNQGTETGTRTRSKITCSTLGVSRGVGVVFSTVGILIMLTVFNSCETIKTSDSFGVSHMYNLILEHKVEGLGEVFGMDAIPETKTLLITERKRARLIVVKDGEITNKISIAIPGRKIRYGLHGGLLDVFVDPNFAENQTVYLTTTLKNKSDPRIANQALVAFSFNEKEGTLSSELSQENIVWEQVNSNRCRNLLNPKSTGARMAMMPDRTLLVSVGQCASETWEKAQDFDSFYGKMLRMTTDGQPVCGKESLTDNPFCNYDDVQAKVNASTGSDGDGDGDANLNWDSRITPYIYSYGHKNQQGIVVDPITGRIFASEHGMRGGDEINLITPGDNYGFPYYCAGCLTYSNTEPPANKGDLDINEFQRPLFVWNYETQSVAVSGAAFYNFPGTLQSNLLVATLKGEAVYQIHLDKNGNPTNRGRIIWGGRMRDVLIQEDGQVIYVLSGSLFGGGLMKFVLREDH